MVRKKSFRGKKRPCSINVRLTEAERAYLGNNPSKAVRRMIAASMKKPEGTFLEHMGKFVNELPERA